MIRYTTYCYFSTCGPVNQPARTSVALCHRRVGDPCFKTVLSVTVIVSYPTQILTIRIYKSITLSFCVRAKRIILIV